MTRRSACALVATLFLLALPPLPARAQLPEEFPRATARPEPSPAGTPAAARDLKARDEALRSGIRDLHLGLYGRAEQAFRAAGDAAPGDPEPRMLVAFTYWWRIVEDRSNLEWDAAFRTAVEAAVAAGEQRLELNREDARAMAASGAASIFQFYVEAARRNPLKAASAARRGHKLLERALLHDPGLVDALFTLGAYNYYAERIPALARGLLFVPKGSAARGLEELRAVAMSDSYFRTDARLLLALICGNREEGCYLDALRHLKLALQENPGSPLVSGSIGSLEMRLGRHPEAVASYERALAAAEGGGADRARQRRSLRLLLAEALAADWRLDEAAAHLPGLAGRDGLPERERRLVERIEVEIALKRGRPPGAAAASLRSIDGTPAGDPPTAVEAALRAQRAGRSSEALEILAAPGVGRQALGRFLAGRILFMEGRYAEADRELAAAAGLDPAPPAWMAGWSELYRGLGQRRLGREIAARAHFNRAATVRRFKSADRALLELSEEPPHALCAP